MQYEITKLTFGEHPVIDISREEYDGAKVAKRNLLEVLSIEQKMNLILENYVEFERELLNSSLNSMMFYHHDWSSSVGEIHLINRRLMNLLATCWLYRDQIRPSFKSIYGSDDEVMQEHYRRLTADFGYRVGEQLRNHIQHRNLPIRRITHDASRQEDKFGRRIRHTVALHLDVNRLKEDERFNRSVLKEIEGLGDSTDVKSLIRQYIESIGRVHLFVRDLLAEDVAAWENTVSQILDRYRGASNGEVLSIAVVARNDSGRIAESIQIFEDVIERRRWLTQKNQILTHFSSHIVTSELQHSNN
ncbi:MAG: hypothetical protein H0V27_01110 [Pyrinomonadaceae bacterium]|nr:hypothetical protein [Pyrinomonadaceae bacterium]